MLWIIAKSPYADIAVFYSYILARVSALESKYLWASVMDALQIKNTAKVSV